MNIDPSIFDRLRDGMSNNKKESGWSAREQIDALRFYLQPNAKIILEYMEDVYQGECFVIFDFEGFLFLWRDSFGSCSGCDALEGADGYEYIKSTLTIGNLRIFHTMKDLKEWLENINGFDLNWDWAKAFLKMIYV